MGPPEPSETTGTSRVWGGHLVSRRDLLKAASLATVGLAASPHMATWTGGMLESGISAADGDPITALAAALDYDAERIFRFVADEIRYDPYGGILRGPRGTLAGRAGNSADQALLLAALLEASLLPVRFAIGEIDSDAAAALLASAEADAEATRRQHLDALGGALPGQGTPPLELTPEERSQLDAASADEGRVAAWARERLERTVEMIGSALREAGVELHDGFSGLPDSERARHVWVQLAQTADWLDLDPSIPGAVPGTASALATETSDALPAEMAHQVELTVIGEVIEGDTLSERRLLGYSERADLLAGVPLAVSNTTPDALSAIGVSVAGQLGGGASYVPVIIVGEEAAVGLTPITLSMEGDAAGSEDPAAGFFGAGPVDGETTAEWVELTIRSPEAEPVVVRRELFDRLGPARRAAGDVTAADVRPVKRVEAIDGGGALAAPALNTHWMTVDTGLPYRGDPVMTVASDRDPRAGALVSQAHHLTRAAATLELALPSGLRPFVDAPNVTAYSLVIRTAPDGELVAESAIDLWHRSYGVVPVSDRTTVLPPAVTSGVLAHVAERVLAGEAMPTGSGVEGLSPVSVGALFDAAADSAVPVRVLQGAGATTELGWDSDARTRLEAALAEGWVAITLEQPIVVGARERIGWWLVDPRTGRTLDQLDDGRGGAFSEYLTALRVWYEALPAWVRIGFCIFTLARGMSAFLTLAMRTAEGKSPLSGWSLAAAAGAGSAAWSYPKLGC